MTISLALHSEIAYILKYDQINKYSSGCLYTLKNSSYSILIWNATLMLHECFFLECTHAIY